MDIISPSVSLLDRGREGASTIRVFQVTKFCLPGFFLSREQEKIVDAMTFSN